MQRKQQEIEAAGGPQKDFLFNLPIKISYERPDLKQILLDSATHSHSLGNTSNEVSVYGCAPHSLNQTIKHACSDASRVGPAHFEFYPEIFI